MSLAFIVGNIALILLVNWGCSCLREKNPLRRLVSREKWNMIFGQVINVLMPLTLPWTFLMLRNGLRSFGSKVNAASYLLLYFLGLVFPIYYFFELLQEREKRLIQERDGVKRRGEKGRKNNNFQMTYKMDMWKMKDEGENNYESNVGLASRAGSIASSIQEPASKVSNINKASSAIKHTKVGDEGKMRKESIRSRNAVTPITHKDIGR
jgi:hypothetical protein